MREKDMELQANKGEVARILQQIEEEYQSAQTGLAGYAVTAQHRLITARMENLGKLHEDLHALVGDQAIKLMAERLETL